MKAVYLALTLILLLSGVVMASYNDGYDDWEDDYYYGDDYYGGSACCCAPMFALAAVGTVAFYKKQ